MWNYATDEFDFLNPTVNTNGNAAAYDELPHSECWGPELPLAFNSPHDSYIIKAVQGGLGISYWESGQTMDIELATQISDCRTWCIANGKAPVFRSLLWMQGETDIINETLATYQTKLEAFINRTRALHPALWNMKVVIVTISHGLTRFTTEEVNAMNAIYQSVAVNLSNIELIDTNSMTLTYYDDLHYDYNGVLAIGNAWSDIINI